MQLHIAGKDRVIEVPDERIRQAHDAWRAIWREPFTKRAWNELLYFALSGLLTALAFAFAGVTLAAGVLLFITFVGVIIIATSVRAARGFGTMYRSLAANLLGEHLGEPPAFAPRPGLFGWLQAALRDRTGWRSIAYTVLRLPLVAFGTWFALSIWIDAFLYLGYPIWGSDGPKGFGILRNLVPPGYFSVSAGGFFHGLFVVLTGGLLFFLAPWPMRLVVYVDRRMMGWLLSPDPLTARMQSLERARTQTVDASAATLRRIERDLHDGTQAQLVALAMRLGQVKEKLAAPGEVDLPGVRELVDEAHRGAKAAIVELRDLARGIHPPVLDVGLEGALATLTARSAVPTELVVSMSQRPTPAIEAIAYFCVAELLANVAQHAEASRAAVSCHGGAEWVRIVVRDDGKGGAALAQFGSSSSGLRGLADRVSAVDGRLDVVSPPGGPTVVTVDLPLNA